MKKEFDVNSYIGIPWKRGGRDRAGFDCWGMFQYIYINEFGVNLDEQYDIEPGQTSKIVKAFQTSIEKRSWEKADKETPEDKIPFAVALSQNKKIHHVGIWIRKGCLHAVEGAGVVYNSMLSLRAAGYAKIELYRWMNVK